MKLAAIQYVGEDGVTSPCSDAVALLLQHGEQVEIAHILTSEEHHHAFLLVTGGGDRIAVKSGFASGYSGEGSHGLSHTLQLLRAHGVELRECRVDAGLMERLAFSALTAADVDEIENSRPRRSNWPDYIFERDWQRFQDKTLWEDLKLSIPMAILDPRLIDIALSFWKAPHDRLLQAWRLLEDQLRARLGSSEYGARLMSQAFQGANPTLRWPNIDATEQGVRGELFKSAFGSCRNPRAHREFASDAPAELSEFLLINHLFRLEAAAVETCVVSGDVSSAATLRS